MHENLNPEEYARKAIEMLEKANKFDEDENNPTKAIDYYRKAAEYLERSGYMPHRVEDIRKRIKELNTKIEQNQVYGQLENQAEADQLQLDAFSLLDKAQMHVKNNQIPNAITFYDQAILKLAKSGWDDTQLINLIQNRNDIAEEGKIEKIDLQQLGIESTEKPVRSDFQQRPSSHSQEQKQEKKQKTEDFQEKKRKEQDIQNEAFSLIDKAKEYEQEKNFEEAIMSYEKAVRLLNSIGWKQQTKNIQTEIERLRQEERKYQQVQSQKKQSDNYLQDVLMNKLASEETDMSKSTDLISFEEKRKQEGRTQKKAFDLIDEGKRLEKEKKYDQAIKNFKEAIKLLREINWDSYIQPVQEFISQITLKKEREQKLKQLREKRENELSQIQERFKKRQKEKFVEASQKLEKNRIEFEKNRLKQIQKEQKFFNILNEADEKLKNGEHENALEKYKKSLELLSNLGSGWDSYIPLIESTIERIKNRQDEVLEQQLEEQKRREKAKEREIEFQEKILSKLEEERHKLREKEIEIKEKEEEKEIRKKLKEKAFKFLDTAREYTNRGNYERAIYAYKEASKIFAQIEWSDEIQIIEEAIESLEKRKSEEKEKEERVLKEKIQKHQEEKEFQELIAQNLREEREKLKEKEIELKQKEEEFTQKQQKRDKAFNLLSEAQEELNKKNFDRAIDLYHNVANLFANIGWNEEVNTIEKAIYEIEAQKEEALKEEREELEKSLEQEEQELQFQEEIANEMRSHRSKLEREKIIQRKQEKELEHREVKREEAFRLLEKAQKSLQENNLDHTLNLYHKVSNIFAHIQWTDEIPIIQDAIEEIKKKKKQKEEWQQVKKQKEIRRETENLALLQKINRLKEKERIKKLKEKELEQKRKELSTQKLEKHNKAFNLLETADINLREGNYQDALKKYKDAIQTLKEIGWSEGYLKVLRENLNTIRTKKEEKEQENQKEQLTLEQRKQERKSFQSSIAEKMERQKDRIKQKKIEIQKQEAVIEQQKERAFSIMDKAEILLDQGNFDEAIENYRKAELILSEIQYPTTIVKEMIEKINQQKKLREKSKNKEKERKYKKEQENKLFQKRIHEEMEFEKERLKEKQLKVKQRENYQDYVERRKNHAFDILEDAEIYLKQGNYRKSLDFYRKAELILNEIHYPTTSIKQMINKVRTKIRREEQEKQKNLERKVQRKKEEKKFQQTMANRIQSEQKRLQQKQIRIQEKQRKKQILEEKKQKAFFLLEKAEEFLKGLNYDQALIHYRKAQLILTEIQYPTQSIEETIDRIQKLKDEKEKEKHKGYEEQLKELEQEKEFSHLIEQRKQYEREKKKAHQLVLAQREKMIQEQQSYREAAYSLLEEAQNYLKKVEPEYEKAISLYSEARDILSEKIGWSPEIKNLNELIHDLQEEKDKFLEKKRSEREEETQRIKEREKFEKELKKRREQELKKKKEKELELEEFKKQKEALKQARDQSLKLIDEAQKFSKVNEFEKAYQIFNQVIENFKRLGWNNQIPYIEDEIKRVKKLEEKVNQEKSESLKLREEIRKKREIEQVRKELKEKKKEEAVSQVGDLTHDVSDLIEKKKTELQQRKKLEREDLKKDAKSFKKDMSQLIKIKEELRKELEEEDERKKQETEKLQKEKEMQELSDIKDMIKAAKKKKEK